MICGHHGIPGGLPAVLDGWICLDTLAWKGLYLTGLDLDTDEIYQSQQSGALRHGVRLGELV